MELQQKGETTPGGTNPPSNEAGFKDSGGSHSMLGAKSLVANQAGDGQSATGNQNPLIDFKPETEKELLLWTELMKAIERISQMERKLTRMQAGQDVEKSYETDEDEFNWAETESRVKNYSKKRKATKSPERITPDRDTPETINSKTNLNMPPPIFVNGVENFAEFRDAVTGYVDQELVFKILANGDVKINTKDSDDYRSLSSKLREAITETENVLYGKTYHTYQCKQEKPFKIVIRGLHPSTSTKEIKTELAAVGHEVTDISNVVIRKKVDGQLIKKPVPLFYVNLAPKDNNKDVYDLEYILHCRVRVEAPYAKKEIPQCKKCQNYGHTHNYCQRKARCVKCAAEHLTQECKKTKQEPCKCANCDGNHTANWKGCPIYQAKLKQMLKPKTTVVNRLQNKLDSYETNTNTDLGKTYAKATNGKLQQNSSTQLEPEPENVEHVLTDSEKIIGMLNDIQTRMNRMEERLDAIDKRSEPEKADSGDNRGENNAR